MGKIAEQAEEIAQDADIRLGVLEVMASKIRDEKMGTREAAMLALATIDAATATRLYAPQGVLYEWRVHSGRVAELTVGNRSHTDGRAGRVVVGGDADEEDFNYQDYVLARLVNVTGKWIPLGDLTKFQCEHLASIIRKQRANMAVKETAWTALAGRLGEKDKVSDKWSEQEVILLFQNER